MEVRSFARRIVEGDSLEVKLAPPPAELTDEHPGPTLRPESPRRPPELAIVAASRAKVPPLEGFPDPHQRARIVHGFANHELQAVELFAWALLAFPEAPLAFRRELVWLVDEEQRHVRRYLARLAAWGTKLGDHPVSGYFWGKVGDLTTPLRFICAMCLTFENANLDHSEEYADAARRAGDPESASLFTEIGTDEIDHVRFGWRWLGRLKEPSHSMWEAYVANLTWPIRPALARGKVFHPAARLAVGMDEDFVGLLAACGRDQR